MGAARTKTVLTKKSGEHAPTHSHAHTQARAHARLPTNAHTHTQTHTRARARPHTHTHAHTRARCGQPSNRATQQPGCRVAGNPATHHNAHRTTRHTTHPRTTTPQHHSTTAPRQTTTHTHRPQRSTTHHRTPQRTPQPTHTAGAPHLTRGCAVNVTRFPTPARSSRVSHLLVNADIRQKVCVFLFSGMAHFRLQAGPNSCEALRPSCTEEGVRSLAPCGR